MNIYVLDLHIETCARYHADQHVSKMILESAQMLCTVLARLGLPAPYKPTHGSHPCTLWAGASLSNWRWLRNLGLALNAEYKYRYERESGHSSANVIAGLNPPPLEDIGLTPFAQAMPEAYREPGDAVQAYRNFYIAEKSAFAKWTRRQPPDWYLAGLEKR